ncbi:MAG: terminase gpA endonuclease subunit, partial [Pirellulales bacterium]
AFAEQEIVIPDGPFEGRRFRCSRQPYTGLWFDAVDTGLWSRYVATGPTQSGKTLAAFIAPLLYHLFEVGETVICGLPDMDMAADKWREDILPVIERSRYRDLMPRIGGGSRGGRVESIKFGNGATLKFMTGGGGDKSRAGFTSRVVVITETDGMDQPGAASRESDKITQLEARTRAYGSRKRIYMECTVSTEEGRTWREYLSGTASKIALRCPHCQSWVTPDREHLVGWKEAPTLAVAKGTSTFSCPACGQLWGEEERTVAHGEARLIHRGQSVDADGNVEGDLPDTDTLGFRWSAVNNLFLMAGDIAGDEWRARNSADEENAEKEMRQYVWCLPAVPLKLDQTLLQVQAIQRRVGKWARGIVPPDCVYLTAAIDLGKYLAHWVLVSWADGCRGHVVDYGRIEVASEDLGVEQAVLVALRQFRELMDTGFPMAESPTSDMYVPDQVWVDSGWMTEVAYAFCRESDEKKYRPSIGRGASQQRHQWYDRPTKTGSLVKHIGEGFHFNWQPAEKLLLVEVDADHWKTWTHQRLTAPVEERGALTLFAATPQEHLSFAKHLTAEVKTEEFIPGKGLVTKWERKQRQNHWLDALYNACAAASFCGVRLLEVKVPERKVVTDWFARQRSNSRGIGFDRGRWNEMQRRYFG